MQKLVREGMPDSQRAHRPIGYHSCTLAVMQGACYGKCRQQPASFLVWQAGARQRDLKVIGSMQSACIQVAWSTFGRLQGDAVSRRKACGDWQYECALQATIQEFMSRVKAGNSQPASGAATPIGPTPTGPAEEQRVAQQAFTALARLIRASHTSAPNSLAPSLPLMLD